MTPYAQGQTAYNDGQASEANPYLDYDRNGMEPLFSAWPNEAHEWWFGWRDAAIMPRD
jgi:hypothetical protein